MHFNITLRKAYCKTSRCAPAAQAFLETHRLWIRQFYRSDLSGFLKLMSDEAVARHLHFTPEQKSSEGAAALFEFVLKSYKGPRAVWVLAIASRPENRFLGLCGLAPNTYKSHMTCFYALLSEFWGFGYASEAMKTLLIYGFQELGLHRVSADTAVDNVRSQAVARKIGMRLSTKRPKAGNRPETVYFSVSRNQFVILDTDCKPGSWTLRDHQ